MPDQTANLIIWIANIASIVAAVYAISCAVYCVRAYRRTVRRRG